MKRFLGAWLVAVFAIGSVACGPDYDRLEISGVKTSPLGGSVTQSKITIPEGMIVKAHIVPWNDDNEQMGAAIRSDDPGVMEVINVVNDRDYAFIANKPGRTSISFEADGKTVLIVDAEVTAQPSQPTP